MQIALIYKVKKKSLVSFLEEKQLLGGYKMFFVSKKIAQWKEMFMKKIMTEFSVGSYLWKTFNQINFALIVCVKKQAGKCNNGCFCLKKVLQKLLNKQICES